MSAILVHSKLNVKLSFLPGGIYQAAREKRSEKNWSGPQAIDRSGRGLGLEDTRDRWGTHSLCVFPLQAARNRLGPLPRRGECLRLEIFEVALPAQASSMMSRPASFRVTCGRTVKENRQAPPWV